MLSNSLEIQPILRDQGESASVIEKKENAAARRIQKAWKSHYYSVPILDPKLTQVKIEEKPKTEEKKEDIIIKPQVNIGIGTEPADEVKSTENKQIVNLSRLEQLFSLNKTNTKKERKIKSVVKQNDVSYENYLKQNNTELDSDIDDDLLDTPKKDVMEYLEALEGKK